MLLNLDNPRKTSPRSHSLTSLVLCIALHNERESLTNARSSRSMLIQTLYIHSLLLGND